MNSATPSVATKDAGMALPSIGNGLPEQPSPLSASSATGLGKPIGTVPMAVQPDSEMEVEGSMPYDAWTQGGTSVPSTTAAMPLSSKRLPEEGREDRYALQALLFCLICAVHRIAGSPLMPGLQPVTGGAA